MKMYGKDIFLEDSSWRCILFSFIMLFEKCARWLLPIVFFDQFDKSRSSDILEIVSEGQV